jgi:phage-related protein
MPGNVANAAPATVLPQNLCRAFTESLEIPVLKNEYRGGETQRRNQASTVRKSWKLAQRLAPSALTTLRSFWEARKGGAEAFYFYNPYEPAAGQKIGSNYDATGVSTTGRYTVVFVGSWSESVGLARADVNIGLLEVA